MSNVTCNCDVKTPDPRHHGEGCPVYLAWRLQDAEAQLASLKGDGGFVPRPQVTMQQCVESLDSLRPLLQRRLHNHGYGVAASIHEILGIVVEEVDELVDEVRANDLEGVHRELMDIAIAAIFGMVSIDERLRWEEIQARKI